MTQVAVLLTSILGSNNRPRQGAREKGRRTRGKGEGDRREGRKERSMGRDVKNKRAKGRDRGSNKVFVKRQAQKNIRKKVLETNIESSS